MRPPEKRKARYLEVTGAALQQHRPLMDAALDAAPVPAGAGRRIRRGAGGAGRLRGRGRGAEAEAEGRGRRVVVDSRFLQPLL